MATAVIMPKVDMVMETGTFVEWLKQEGDQVEDWMFDLAADPGEENSILEAKPDESAKRAGGARRARPRRRWSPAR